MTKRLAIFSLALVAWLTVCGMAFAASAGDIDRLSTYAVLLGRGAACGAAIDGPSRQVGAWIDRTWSGSERAAMLQAFAAGMENAARQQRGGQSPDSCNQIKSVLNATVWP